MLYFAQRNEELKIGYAQDAGKRLKQHAQYGFESICAMPGTIDDEVRLHRYFERHLIRGKEFYNANDEILEYIILLMERGFSHPQVDIATELPEIPYSVWGPENLSPHAVEVNGQISLLSRLPIKNRLEITAKQLQNSSLTDEWYTPEDLVELGRLSLGGEIYTDPATSVAVNGKFIKAKLFYTRQTNGLDLTLPWRGSVWLNPPYGRGEGSAGQFILRLCSELRQGNVTNAVTCLNVASMSSKWFYTQIPQLVQAHCIVNGRPNFYPPTGQSAATSPTKGIVISYFGADAARFCEIWRSTGQILVPRQCL